MPGTQAALERVEPEQADVDSQGIVDFLRLVEDKQINMHSFMLLRRGLVAAEGYCRPFGASTMHPIFSVSKSVTSAAIGIAIGEGRLSLEDRVVDFFPDKLTGPSHRYTTRMTVEHLLQMTTVHPRSVETGADWVKSFLTAPPSHAPGTVFGYDTIGTHTLCAILQRITGLTVHQYLQPRLFEAIGMGEIEWDSCPMNINKGGSGIRCTTEALARFGQLYLQQGVWNGRSVLPEGWVERSASRLVDNTHARMLLDGGQGYGYQFWRCRHNAYCAFGMGGQFVVVIPEKEAVFVSTANTMMHKDGHQMILDALWEALYPAMAGQKPAGVGAEDRIALRRKLDELSLIIPKGRAASSIVPRISGRRWLLAPNPPGFDACEFDWSGGNAPQLRFYSGASRADVRFGLNCWLIGREPFSGSQSANAGTWVDERTCVIHIQLLDALQMFMLTCSFTDDGLLVIRVTPAGAVFKHAPAYSLNGELVRAES